MTVDPTREEKSSHKGTKNFASCKKSHKRAFQSRRVTRQEGTPLLQDKRALARKEGTPLLRCMRDAHTHDGRKHSGLHRKSTDPTWRPPFSRREKTPFSPNHRCNEMLHEHGQSRLFASQVDAHEKTAAKWNTQKFQFQ